MTMSLITPIKLELRGTVIIIVFHQDLYKYLMKQSLLLIYVRCDRFKICNHAYI